MNSKKTDESSSTKEGISATQKNLIYIRSTLEKAMTEIKQQSSSCRALSFIKRISLDLDFQKTEKMLYDLQKGYLVVKHSPNTSQGHNKFLYISSNHRFLCWKSFERQDEKMLELRKIQTIIKNDVNSLLESTTVKNFQETLIIHSQTRSLEVQFKSLQEKDKFYEELTLAMKNSRRMHLSYKF